MNLKGWDSNLFSSVLAEKSPHSTLVSWAELWYNGPSHIFRRIKWIFNVKKEFVSQYHYDARNFEGKENGIPETKVDVNSIDQSWSRTKHNVFDCHLELHDRFLTVLWSAEPSLKSTTCLVVMSMNQGIQQRRSGRIESPLLEYANVWLTKSQKLPLIYRVLIWSFNQWN